MEFTQRITGNCRPTTDRGDTGQRNYSYINLLDYGARWYSPSLGRFTQPDSIVPDMTNTQSWNRFAYVNNNPVNNIDPTGHFCIGTTCSEDIDSDGVWWHESMADDYGGQEEGLTGSTDEESPFVEEAEGLVGDLGWCNPKQECHNVTEGIDDPGSDFYDYFYQGIGDIEQIMTMNCWELVLFASLRAGIITEQDIFDFYSAAESRESSVWSQLGADNAVPISEATPSYGQLVFFTPELLTEPTHVAISLGGNEVISIWDRPNGYAVQITTIQAIVTAMYDGRQESNGVTVTAADWPP